MKIGVYGGSFNPIHYGHIGLARWIAEHTELDEVWMLVSPHNPLKAESGLADEQSRLDAVRRAIAESGCSRIVASDFEFHLPRPTYTAATLRALSERYPEHEFTLVIGQDNIEIFDRWKEYEWIAANYPIYVYPRETEKKAEEAAKSTEDITRRIGFKNLKILLNAPLFPVSSTQIRAQMQKK